MPFQTAHERFLCDKDRGERAQLAEMDNAKR